MPDQPRRLFLSMVSDEFRSYRELLCSDLERGRVDITTQEKFANLGATTLEKLDDYMEKCDAVIHLVGDGLGHVPPAAAVDALLDRHRDFLETLAKHTGLTREILGTCSYTQWEAYLAIFHHVRLHIYRPNPKAPREPDFIPNAADKALQEAHFQRIRDLGRDRDVFLNQERLSSFVLADLNDILPARTGDTADVSVSKLTHAARELIGREPWLAQLDEAWADEACHVAILKAWGGIGKTALTAAWRAEREYKGWREARRVFDWSFYSQGTRDVDGGESAVSADAFIAKALEFFGDSDPTAGSPWDRGERLARLVAAEKSLLILDGIEPLQHPPGPMAGHLTDPALAALLLGLAGRNPGLCIVTTREHVTDLDGHHTVSEWELDHLTDAAGAAVLHAQGVTHAGAAEIGPDDAELRTASREVEGHALTLTLMGKYLALACDGDIRRRDTFALAEADPEWVTRFDPTSPYGHAFKVIAAYERWFLDAKAERSEAERRQGRLQLAILRLLGLFNRPASSACLTALREAPAIEGLTEALVDLPPRDWAIALSRLEAEALVKRDPPHGAEPALDAHPLVREYFAKQL
ncbi:MAG: hypothetical protein KDM91_14210, partial [Verrucomicrobiae bacterium]|nr:hypothetical protein [Verrucomicrobiae bacterium]